MKKDIINISIVNKGRLKTESENIFKKAKLKILSKSDRSLVASIKGYPLIRVIYQNATEIIQALGTGVCQIGISGKDLWRESDANIQSKISLVKQYEWGKSELVVAVSTSWLDCVNPTDLEEISFEFFNRKKRLMRCATKFKNLTNEWMSSRGITQYDLVTSLGATENSVEISKADFITDLSSSGETLRQNNLKIIDDGVILKSSACLFAAKNSLKNKEVKKILKLLIQN